MFKKQKQQVSYLTLKQRITAGVMAFFMLGQICFPAVAAAAYLTSDETITQALSSNFFERASTSSYLYQKSDLAYSGNLSNQNIASFHKRLVDNKISLPAPTYIPIAGDITIIVPHQPVGKLVGDVYVQNRLVRQQVFNQLGRHLIDPENNDSEFVQINKLYNNAYVYAQRTGKIYGTKLSASDMAYLNSQGLDILWPEHRLIDGATVVVPILYLTENTVATQSVNDHVIEFFGEHNQLGSVTISNQLLRVGRNSFLDVRDVKLKNGTIKSEGNIAIKAAENLSASLGSVIDADSSLDLRVGGIFSLIDGSQIIAKNNASIHAERAELKTFVHLFTDRYGQGTRLSEISNITAGGDISITSSQDITLEASKITSSNGAITLSAGTDINILPVTTQYSSEYKVGDWEVSQNSLNAIGSSLSANDTIKLIAGGAINITASELISTQGGIELLAEQGIHVLDSLDQTQIQKVDRKGKTKGHASEFRTEAVRSILKAGKGVLLDTEFGDVVLRATNISSAAGTQVAARNGKVRLLMTKELEESHLQTVRKSTWTIKTRTEEIIHENNIQNAIVGGLQVQAMYGIDIEYTGTIDENHDLADQIEEFRSMPGLAWIAELYDQHGRSNVNWEEMEEIHKELRRSKSSLSPAAMAIVAICVAVVTGGAGTGLAGAIQGSVSGALQGAIGASAASTFGYAVSAGAVALSTQVAQNLAAGNSLRDTVNSLDSDDSLRNLAVSMVTAGALKSMDIGNMELFEAGAGANQAVVSLANQAVQTIATSAITSGIAVTINGGNSEDYLNAFNESLLANSFNALGNKLASKISGPNTDLALKYISHAALGCLSGVVTEKITDSDLESACESGAGGAVISQAAADLLKAKLDQVIQDARDGKGSILEISDLENQLRTNGADISRLVAAMFAFALGGDVDVAADASERVARSNLYRYASLIQVNEILEGRVGSAPGVTFAEKMAYVYEQEARLTLQDQGVSTSVQESLLGKAKSAGLFDSAAKYHASFTGDGQMYEDVIKSRQEATYETGMANNESMDLDILVIEQPYGEVAQHVFDFMGATNQVVNLLTPEERLAASALFTVATGGIKTALVWGAQIGAAQLMPEGLPDVTSIVARAGVAFTLNRSYDYIRKEYDESVANPIDIDVPGYSLNEAVDGFGWLLDNITGLRSPVKNTDGVSVHQARYENNHSNGTLPIAGPGRVHPSFVSLDSFYNQAKSGPLNMTVTGRYSHYREGEFVKYNDGKLGERVMVDVLEASTGKKFVAIQNLSGHGPDGVYIDRTTNPATIFLAEAKSSINGADSARIPTGSPAARLAKWIADYDNGKYNNADASSLALLEELKDLRISSGAPVKGIWVQTEVPHYNSSNINELKVIVNAWQ